MSYTIAQVEQAINFWRDREGPHDGYSLGKTASSLAEVYASMIYQHAEVVETSRINKALVSDIELALRQQSLL